MRFVVALALAILVAMLPAGARADGGGRAESVTAGAGNLWTTLRNGVVAVDPVSGRFHSTIVTNSFGRLIGLEWPRVWLVDARRLVAVDAAKRRVQRRVSLRHASYEGAVGYDGVWLPSFQASVLTKIDAQSGDRRWEVRVPRSPQGVTLAGGSVWVASVGSWHSGRGGTMIIDGPGVVTRLDPSSGRVRARVVVGRGPGAATAGMHSVWILNSRGIGPDDTLDRIDIRTNRVAASIHLPHGSVGVACGASYCWVVSQRKTGGEVLTRVDPHTNRTFTRAIPRSWFPAAVATVRGRVWVGDPGVAELIRIDPRTLRVTKRVKIPPS